MKNQMLTFIAAKSLSQNSQKSYLYDLQQFCDLTQGQVSDYSLKRYEQSLRELKLSAQKRKLSTVNQFLFFLYEKGTLDRFYKIKSSPQEPSRPCSYERMNLSKLEDETHLKTGQLIACLILELGLTPSDMIQLKVADLDFDFQVMTLKTPNRGMRVLEIPEHLCQLLKSRQGKTYLFDNKGHSYSRQWLFKKLSAYLNEIGYPDLTAQKLREQCILREKAKGVSMMDLSQKLGLKSPMTLEKYYRN